MRKKKNSRKKFNSIFFLKMSSGRESKPSDLDQTTINSDSKIQRNNIGVSSKRIKKETRQRKRQKRTHEKANDKDNFVKRFKQSFVKRRQNASGFVDVPTDQDYEKIEDWARYLSRSRHARSKQDGEPKDLQGSEKACCNCGEKIKENCCRARVISFQKFCTRNPLQQKNRLNEILNK